MRTALESAITKLREYYAKTDDPALGDIYAHGTILAPEHKLQFFSGPDWKDKDYASLYLETFKDRMKLYQTEGHIISKPQASAQTEFDQMIRRNPQPTQDQDELTRFLQGGKLLFSLFSHFSLTFLPFHLICVRPPLFTPNRLPI
jgi:hypothetical protein